MRYLKKRLHNFILKFITISAITIDLFIMTSIDSYDNLSVPLLVFSLCTGWICLFNYANNVERDKK